MQIISQEQIDKSVVIKFHDAVVSSDTLAKMFDKQHKDILRIIRNKEKSFIETDFPGEKFRLGKKSLKVTDFFIREQVNKPQGGSFTRYWLTRKGFDFIALSLTGKKADIYKIWYIEAFHEREALVLEHKLTAKLHYQDLEWRRVRAAGKEKRLSLTDAINETVVKYRAEHEKKFSDGHYFLHYTKLIYKTLNIDIPRGASPRDTLSPIELDTLKKKEQEVADMIMVLTDKGMYYKDVYKEVKNKLLD